MPPDPADLNQRFTDAACHSIASDREVKLAPRDFISRFARTDEKGHE